MTISKGVIVRDDDGEMFVGWAKAPAIDRRFLLAALPASLAATTGVGYFVSRELSDPGAGSWNTGATHEVTGIMVKDPYPMIRVADETAPFGVRSVLIVAQGKCTSALDLAANDQQIVTASGVLIERKNRQMLEVPLLLGDWLKSVASAADPVVVLEEVLGRAMLGGFIMDTKCFFGVMRPGRGKTHKACAALCIRGGIPPSFWARGEDGREVVLLMTDANGGPLGEEILPLVADPVRAEGEIVRVGDLLQFRADASAFVRV